jgi:hypothetical protein
MSYHVRAEDRGLALGGRSLAREREPVLPVPEKRTLAEALPPGEPGVVQAKAEAGAMPDGARPGLALAVQQRAGTAKGGQGAGLAVNRDPGLEAEADRAGERAAPVGRAAPPPAAIRSRATSSRMCSRSWGSCCWTRCSGALPAWRSPSTTRTSAASSTDTSKLRRATPPLNGYCGPERWRVGPAVAPEPAQLGGVSRAARLIR